MKRISMVAGEASGDNLAAGLIRAMKQQDLEFEVSGICGPAMIAEGATALYTIDAINNIGIDGLLSRIRSILVIRKNLVERLLENKPDIYIGIDAPDFNLAVEKQLRKAGVPTVQYVGPSIWAWRGYRIRKIKQAVSKILTIYPFEEKIYERAQVPFTYVGHPLADEITVGSLDQVRSKFHFDDCDTVIAVLPGSRMSEVKRLADIFIKTALKLQQTHKNIKFITPVASREIRYVFSQKVKAIAPSLPIQIVDRNSIEVIAAADVVLLASGTAALEAALCRKPVVVAYRISLVSLIVLKLLGHVKHYSILNHLGSAPVIPEFMQGKCTVDNLLGEINKYLEESAYREHVLNKFEEFRISLECNASAKAAEEIVRILGK